MDCVSLHSRCVDRKKSSWCIESAIKRKEVLSTTTTIGPGCSLIAHAAWVCELISVFLRPHSCCSGGSCVVLSARHNSLRYSTARHHSSSTVPVVYHTPPTILQHLLTLLKNLRRKYIIKRWNKSCMRYSIFYTVLLFCIYNIYIRLYAVLSWNWCFRP